MFSIILGLIVVCLIAYAIISNPATSTWVIASWPQIKQILGDAMTIAVDFFKKIGTMFAAKK